LGRYGEGKEDQVILDRLAEIGQKEQFLTRMATINALKALKIPKALPLLEQIAHTDPDGRVVRTALEAINEVRVVVSREQELKNLREAVEALQKTNQELKSRLDVLEQLKS
jgi:aminopeptidase N